MVDCAWDQKLPKLFPSAFGVAPKPGKPLASIVGIAPKPGKPPKDGIGIIPKPPGNGVGIVPKPAFCISNPLKPGFTTLTVTSGFGDGGLGFCFTFCLAPGASFSGGEFHDGIFRFQNSLVCACLSREERYGPRNTNGQYCHRKKVQEPLNTLVRQSVEETLNNLLNAEADALCNASRDGRSSDRLDTREGTYKRKLLTKAGEGELQVPCRANKISFRVWLEDVLRRFSSTPAKEIDSLPPSKLEACRFSAGLIPPGLPFFRKTKKESLSTASTCITLGGCFHLAAVCRSPYFFSTGTFDQPEVDSVNSRAEKHQMTTFLFLIQAASFAALR